MRPEFVRRNVRGMRLIGIPRLRQRHEADPEIFGADIRCLAGSIDKAGDEQRRAREQVTENATCAPTKILRKRC